MSDLLKLKYYSFVLRQTKRGNSYGRVINAKPILLISIIEKIREGEVSDNKIYFDDILKENYKKIHLIYESNKEITPIYKPFFHLTSDGYWHIEWKNKMNCTISSEKKLRENIKYACFDNALWDLLKDDHNCKSLLDVIKNHFFKDKNLNYD